MNDVEQQPLKSAASTSSLNTVTTPIREHLRSKSQGDTIDWTPFVARHVRTLYQKREGGALDEAKMTLRNFSVVAMADISG